MKKLFFTLILAIASLAANANDIYLVGTNYGNWNKLDTYKFKFNGTDSYTYSLNVSSLEGEIKLLIVDDSNNEHWLGSSNFSSATSSSLTANGEYYFNTNCGNTSTSIKNGCSLTISNVNQDSNSTWHATLTISSSPYTANIVSSHNGYYNYEKQTEYIQLSGEVYNNNELITNYSGAYNYQFTVLNPDKTTLQSENSNVPFYEFRPTSLGDYITTMRTTSSDNNTVIATSQFTITANNDTPLYTVYFDNGWKNDSSWNDVYVWIYDSKTNKNVEDSSKEWPGYKTETVVINGKTYWKYSFRTSNDMTNAIVIFNGGDDYNKTNPYKFENNAYYEAKYVSDGSILEKTSKLGTTDGTESTSFYLAEFDTTDGVTGNSLIKAEGHAADNQEIVYAWAKYENYTNNDGTNYDTLNGKYYPREKSSDNSALASNDTNEHKCVAFNRCFYRLYMYSNDAEASDNTEAASEKANVRRVAGNNAAETNDHGAANSNLGQSASMRVARTILINADGVTTGVADAIFGASQDDATAEYFNLNGVQVNAENLTPGIYIVRRGTQSAKLLVR